MKLGSVCLWCISLDISLLQAQSQGPSNSATGFSSQVLKTGVTGVWGDLMVLQLQGILLKQIVGPTPEFLTQVKFAFLIRSQAILILLVPNYAFHCLGLT